MIMGNVSERRKQPPQVGVSVVILALGPASHGTQEHARTSADPPCGYRWSGACASLFLASGRCPVVV